jgi:hypothetical protein
MRDRESPRVRERDFQAAGVTAAVTFGPLMNSLEPESAAPELRNAENAGKPGENAKRREVVLSASGVNEWVSQV